MYLFDADRDLSVDNIIQHLYFVIDRGGRSSGKLRECSADIYTKSKHSKFPVKYGDEMAVN